MKRKLLTLIVALLAGVTTFAQDYTELKLDEVFTIKNFGDEVWTFTAPESGVAKIVGDNGDGDWIGSCLVVNDDAEFTNEVHSYVNNTYYEFVVEAGHVYYIRNWNWTGQDFKAHITMGVGQFAVTVSDPADGGQFYITSDNNATITFSSTVGFVPKAADESEEDRDDIDWTVGSLTIGDNVINIYNFTDYNALVRKGIFTYTEEGTSGIVDWNGNICARVEGASIVVSFTSATGRGYFNVVNRLLEEGKMQAGDPMTFTLHGVKSAATGDLLNGDGVLTMTWYCAGAPTVLTEATVPEVIKSWYNPGDPEGVARFTFSRGIQSATAVLEMGQGEGADDLYTETIAPDHLIIDGNTVCVDLSGVMRTRTTMGLKMNWTQFTLTLTQVVDENGQPTFSEDLGSASTYAYTTGYADITRTLSYEITPASGSTLTADNKTVEIWFGEDGLIEYDGAYVTYYTMETVTETITENVYNEETGEWETITRDVETEQNVAHDTFIPRSDFHEVADVDGTTITLTLPEGTYEAKNVIVRLNVTGSTDGVEHTVVAYYNTQLMYGLPVALAAEPASESTVHRLSEIYFPLNFVYSINNKVPNPVTVLSKTDPAFRCGGSVVADGMTQFKIVLDEPISAEGAYTVAVAEGVIGDYNYGESQYYSGTTHEAFNLYYAVDGKYDGRDVICEPFDGETVACLSQFSVTFFDYPNVAPSWDVEKYAYVRDAEGKEYTGAFAESFEATDHVVFTLDTPITEAGTYTFVLTAGSVVNAATGDPINVGYEFTFTVDGSYVPDAKPVLTPAEGTYDELASIRIDFGQPVTVVEESEENGWWVQQPLLASDDFEQMYAGKIYATEDPNVVEWFTFDGTPVVKAGELNFNIPAGCVQFADGSFNGEFTYSYTITGANAVTLNVVATTPEQWSEVETLSELTVTFDQPVTIGEWPMATANNSWWDKYAEGTIVATDDPCTVKIVFDTPLEGYGETTVTINPYTLFVADGKAYDEAIYINLTVGEYVSGGGDDPNNEENVTIWPDGLASAFASLRYFEITFGGYMGAWNEKPIRLEDAYGKTVATVAAYGMSGESQDGTWFWEQGRPNTYSITLPVEITEDGYYTLVVPVVCELADGSTVNREYYFSFGVDRAIGVKDAFAAQGKADTYTVGGTRVSRITKPGLYIVNGRKVVVRQ